MGDGATGYQSRPSDSKDDERCNMYGQQYFLSHLAPTGSGAVHDPLPCCRALSGEIRSNVRRAL